MHSIFTISGWDSEKELKKKDSNNTVKLKMLFAREMQHSGRLPFYLIQKMETVTQTTCNLFQTSEVLKPGTSAAFGTFL